MIRRLVTARKTEPAVQAFFEALAVTAMQPTTLCAGGAFGRNRRSHFPFLQPYLIPWTRPLSLRLVRTPAWGLAAAAALRRVGIDGHV